MRAIAKLFGIKYIRQYSHNGPRGARTKFWGVKLRNAELFCEYIRAFHGDDAFYAVGVPGKNNAYFGPVLKSIYIYYR